MSAGNESSSLVAPIVLLVSAVIGFFIANSPALDAYTHFLHTSIEFYVGSIEILDKDVLHLVNDGLMAIFFLFIGLELKREIVVGELSDMRKAMLPILCAIGGMVVPALVYYFFNMSGPEASGWGIPMATDIAFAIGILALLGSRVPAELKILLAAIAIVDDLGAILVIAIFYTAQIKLWALAAAAACFAICLVINRMGVMKVSLYIAFGIPMWYFMLKSGVHATIAGVLLASTIPLAPKALSTAKLISDIYEDSASPLDSPAVFLEKSLLVWVSFLIIPIFAFCNSGVSLSSVSFGSISLGVILGLVVGKPLGICLATLIASKTGIASMPRGVNFQQIAGTGFLAGIGFTMSLFISSLAFTDMALNEQAKLSILIASIIAGSIGTILLILANKKKVSAL